MLQVPSQDARPDISVSDGIASEAVGTKPGPYWRWSKPFYVMMRFLGYIPFELSTGDEPVTSRRCWMWAILVFFLQMNVQFAYYAEILRNPRFWQNYLALLDTMFRFMVNSVLPQFIAAWLSLKLFLDYITSWRPYEGHFENITGKAMPSVGSWFGILNISIALVFTFGILIFDRYQSYSQDTPFTLVPYYFPIVYSFILNCLWIYNILFIALTARVYRLHLNKVLRADCGRATIHDLRMLWLGLNHRAGKLASALSPVLVIHILKFFCVFLFASYSSVNLLIAAAWFKAIPYIAASMGSLVFLASISETSHYMNDQVEMFVDCIAAKSKPIELGGFISLNRQFGVQILSSIVMYLVVLVQFDIRR